VTGDTVWFDGVADVLRRFTPDLIVLFAGAARTRGSFHLTMNTNDAIEVAAACPNAVIVPVHYDSWAHFSQNRADLEQSFNALGVGSRLRVLESGMRTRIDLPR
jgi:L-ascorbate metabolism protein UlaG (beta-lactamase superfamily)